MSWWYWRFHAFGNLLNFGLVTVTAHRLCDTKLEMFVRSKHWLISSALLYVYQRNWCYYIQIYASHLRILLFIILLNTHKAAQHKKAVKNNIYTIVQIKELKAYRLFKRAPDRELNTVRCNIRSTKFVTVAESNMFIHSQTSQKLQQNTWTGL